MCTYIVLAFLVFLATSFRGIGLSISPAGEYLSHNRTRALNTFSILLIILGHTCIHSPCIEQANDTFHSIYQSHFRIWAVGSCFLFSGYGIMESLKKSETYIRKLIFKRFPFLLFAIYSLPLILWCLSGDLFTFSTEKLTGRFWSILGVFTDTPWYWFITMTLFMYILTVIAYVISGTKNKYKRTSIIVLGLAIISCLLLSDIRPWFWLDTILCFPCGMLISAFRDSFEKLMHKCRIPHFILGGIFIFVGSICLTQYWELPSKIAYCLNLIIKPLSINPLFIRNIYGNFSVIPVILGGVLCFGCIKISIPNRFLLWFGGSAVMYLYLLHGNAINALNKLGLPQERPNTSALIIVINSIIMAFAAQSAINSFFKLLRHKDN